MKEKDLLQTLIKTLPHYVYEQEPENQHVSGNESEPEHSPEILQKAATGLLRLVRLNELLLDTLPHPALLIRRDRTVLLANRIAQDMGAVIGEPYHPWGDVCFDQQPVNLPEVKKFGRIWVRMNLCFT